MLPGRERTDMIEFQGARLAMTSELDHLAEARGWVAARCRDAGLDDEGINEVGLAVTEALTNVIRHSYEGRPGNPIDIHAVVQPGGLLLMISDQGHPFAEESYGGVDLAVAHEGVYGVFLIEQLMDSVTRHSPTRGEMGTDLVLIKGTISDGARAK